MRDDRPTRRRSTLWSGIFLGLFSGRGTAEDDGRE